MRVAKRRIRLDRPFERWVDIALALPGIQLAPLEPAIAAPIITPDDRLRSYPHVQSAW